MMPRQCKTKIKGLRFKRPRTDIYNLPSIKRLIKTAFLHKRLFRPAALGRPVRITCAGGNRLRVEIFFRQTRFISLKRAKRESFIITGADKCRGGYVQAPEFPPAFLTHFKKCRKTLDAKPVSPYFTKNPALKFCRSYMLLSLVFAFSVRIRNFADFVGSQKKHLRYSLTGIYFYRKRIRICY